MCTSQNTILMIVVLLSISSNKCVHAQTNMHPCIHSCACMHTYTATPTAPQGTEFSRQMNQSTHLKVPRQSRKTPFYPDRGMKKVNY